MSTNDRRPGVWKAAPAALPPRAATAGIMLVLAVAAAGELRSAARIETLQRDAYPALLDARALTGTLAAVRAEQQRAGTPGHAARLDSLGDAFHTVARAAHGGALTAIDTRFDEYLDQTRRSALGIVSSDESGISAPAAEAASRVLDAELSAATQRAERDVAESIAAANAQQSYMMMALIVSGAIALLLVAALAWGQRAARAAWIDGLAETVDALAAGDLSVVIRDSADASAGRLGASLRRLARQLRDNTEAAQALAAGAFRGVRPSASCDPLGVALAQLSQSMTEIAVTSQRVARGDVGVVVTPRSPSDAFGVACAAMLRRVVTTLDEVERARVEMMGMIDAMRGDAAALASSANIDADRLRRTEERLTSVSVQARSDVMRGTILTERAAESGAMLTAGSLAMQSSLEGLAGVLRSADVVQDLARKAGLLAVRAAVVPAGGIEAAAVLHATEARALATDAAAAGATITRLMIGGTEHAYEAGVAFDRVAIAVKDSTSLVQEIGAASQRQAAELHEIDATVSQVTRTTSNSAETARQLVHRLDALAAQARRIEATVRRASRSRSAGVIAVAHVVPAPVRSSMPMAAHA